MSSTRTELEKVTLEKDIGEQLRGVTINQNIITNTVLEPHNIALTGQKKKLEKSQSKTEEKTIPQIGGLPQYTIQLDSDIDKHYEKQIVGSNNCFAITAAALYNQHIKNRADGKPVSEDELLDQYDVRGYKPKIVSKDEYKKHGINNADLTYDSDSAELREFARLDSKTMGNIFSLSDLFLQLDNDVCVKNMTLTTANLDEAARHDMYELFLNSLSKALLKKEAVGLYTSSDRHYITVVGVEGENIKYLDSSSENPNEIKTKHLTKVFFGDNCTVEMTWLEEIEKETNINGGEEFEKKPADLSKKYEKISKEGDDYVYTPVNQQEEQIEGVHKESYINDAGLYYGVAAVLTDEEKKTKESVSDSILKNVVCTVYVPKNKNTPKLDLGKYRHDQSAERADAIRALKAYEVRVLGSKDEGFVESGESKEEIKALKNPVIGSLNTKSFNVAASFFTSDNATGKSETFVALRRALKKADTPLKRKQGEKFTPDKASLLDQLQRGQFHLTDENYATFIDLYQAVSAYVADHISSWSSETQKRYEKACEMKSMLDHVARESIRKNTGEVNEPAIFFNNEEKKAAIKNVERQLDYYKEYCKKTDKNLMLSSEEKLVRKWDALKVFERDVQIYIHLAETEAARKDKPLKGDTFYLVQEYRSLRQQMKLRDLAKKSGFERAFKNETTDLIRDHSYNMYKDGLKKQRGRVSAMDGDDGLDKTQIQAINMIDQWVVRNVRNRNIASPFSQENRIDISAKLLSMPRRKRLYIYYLVETRERVNPSMSGFYMSQTSALYIPTLEGFKKHMIATRWKFYKRISRDHIYWDKLTQAMLIADQSTPIINQVSQYMKAGDALEAEKKGETKEKITEKETEIDTTSKENAQKEKAIIDEETANKKIKDKLILFARNGQMAIRLMKEKEEATGKAKEVKEKALKDLQEEAITIINDIWIIATQVSQTPGKSFEESEKKDTQLHYGSTFADNAQKVLSIVGNTINDATIYGTIINQKAELLQIVKGYGQGVGALGGVAATVGACFTLAAILDNPHPVTGWDITSTTMTFANGVVKAATGIAGLANAIKPFSDSLSAAGPALAVLFAGVETANAVIKTGSAARNGYHRNKASKLYNKRREELEWAGKKIEADKYRDGMLKLNEKLSQREAVASIGSVFTAGASVTAAALFLAGTITVGVTAIVGGVVLVAALAARSINREYSKSMKVELFDAYYEIPALYEKVRAKWIEKNDGQKPTKDQEEEMLKSLRQRVSAESGFFSPAHAATYIANRYADHMITKAHSNDPDSEMYVQMIKGLGLKYEYDREKGIEIPTASDIVKKLCR